MPYKQCTLQRTKQLGEGLSTTVTFIPSKLATVGKFVELKEGNQWNSWQVIKASQIEISDDHAQKVQKKFHDGWNNNI
jgi:hypothetical protein